MKNENVLRSTALLTLSGIGAKTIDFVFRAYYSRLLGSEGLGLFSLCFTVHGLMLNIATGGIGVAVSKIVSEKFVKHEYDEINATMKVAMSLVFALSAVVIALTCIFANQIAKGFLNEQRCAKSIICLAPSVLFMGISYCIKGYFYASRRVLPPASSEFLEQAVKILSITYLLGRKLPYGIEQGCEAVFTGLSLGEFSSCLYLSIFYAADKGERRCGRKVNRIKTIGAVAKIAVPVMTTSLATSLIRSREEVLIVSSLQKSGLTHEASLGIYGEIRGMIMPLVIFPLTLLSSCFTMLVPEISRAYARQNSVRLRTLVSKIYRFCTFFGFLVACIIVTYSGELAKMVYNAPDIARHLKIIALLCPLMFVDSVSCGILNGMGKQGALLVFSFADAISRIMLITILLPRFGTGALIFTIMISNMLTPYLTMEKVLKVSKIHFQWSSWCLKHLVCAVTAYFVADSIFMGFCQNGAKETVIAIALTAGIYFTSGVAFSSTSRSDWRWLAERTFLNT